MFEDRQYQLDDVNYAVDHGNDLRPIHCAPTGSGKTVIQAFVAQRELQRGNRTAILTPREEIFYQTHSVLNEIVGWTNVAMLKAGERWRPEKPVHVVGWHTLTRRSQKSQFWYPDIDRLIVDEAHLATAPRILKVLEYYRERGTVIDGYTATPARKSGTGLGSFFTNIKHVTTVRQLITEGKLAPLEYWAGKLADISKVRTTAGDYNSKDLSEASQPLIGDVIDNWLRIASDKHTLVFAVDIPHCEALTERFQRAGISAESVHVRMTHDQRERVIDGFRNRRIQVLVNVMIASYGFDVPSIDCIVVARPTKSLVLHLQVLGRGMRTNPGKEACLVLDHADNVRRLGLAEDLYRWRLGFGQKASENWTRDERNTEKQEGEDKVYECDECHYLFSRSRICPKCGWEVPIPKRDVETIDADLVRISKKKKDTAKQAWPTDKWFYAMLRHWADEHGYKPGWVYFKFKEKTKREPEKEWDCIPTVKPTERVRNWIFSRQIAFARKRKKEQAVA